MSSDQVVGEAREAQKIGALTDAAIKSTGRGNGKSTEEGALATWALFDDDSTGSPQVPVIATTIGQAIRSCYGVAVQMVKPVQKAVRVR